MPAEMEMSWNWNWNWHWEWNLTRTRKDNGKYVQMVNWNSICNIYTDRRHREDIRRATQRRRFLWHRSRFTFFPGKSFYCQKRLDIIRSRCWSQNVWSLFRKQRWIRRMKDECEKCEIWICWGGAWFQGVWERWRLNPDAGVDPWLISIVNLNGCVGWVENGKNENLKKSLEFR